MSFVQEVDSATCWNLSPQLPPTSQKQRCSVLPLMPLAKQRNSLLSVNTIIMPSYLPSRRLKLHYSQQGGRAKASSGSRRHVFRIALATLGAALAVWLCRIHSHASQAIIQNNTPIIMEANIGERKQELKKEPFVKQVEKTSNCPAPASHETIVDDTFLDSMFTRVSTDERFAHYKPRIILSPTENGENPPWIMVLDNFLPSHEDVIQHLQSDSIQQGFYRSVLSQTGTNDKYRKSSSYNCYGTCLEQDWVLPIVQGMQDVTGLSMRNGEDITFTHYKVGGFYGKHHDYTLKTTNPRGWEHCGPRILTFLVYLNTVEQGGATSFFHLGKQVEPKAGRALIFPNVFPKRPMDKNEQTAHEALVVEKGEKYIAQSWFHPFDYRANMDNNCCA